VSKKDYKAIAVILSQFLSRIGDEDTHDGFVREVIVPMAQMFKVENSKFDYSRFLAACGVDVS
jgi:hypothetical protein